MALLQPKLSLKVAQRQILTPGLMQMVSVLALNKLELKEMINAEITENPILEEIEESVPLLDEVAAEEIQHDRATEMREAEAEPEKRTDPFEEIDFGSYFQEYLDPGYRTSNNFEITEAPSLENYLSSPGTLTDHIFWQLGSLNLLPAVRDAAEYIIGNLNEDGYLTATDEELLEGYLREQLAPQAHPAGQSPIAGLPPAMLERARAHLASGLAVVRQLDPVGIGTRDLRECLLAQVEAHRREFGLIFEKEAFQKQDQARRDVQEEAAHGLSPAAIFARHGMAGRAPAENGHAAADHGVDAAADAAADGTAADDTLNLAAAAEPGFVASSHPNGHTAAPAWLNGAAGSPRATLPAAALPGTTHPGTTLSGTALPGAAFAEAAASAAAGDAAGSDAFPAVDSAAVSAGPQASASSQGPNQIPSQASNQPSPIDPRVDLFDTATRIIDKHLALLQKRDPRELGKAVGRPLEAVQQAIDFIRTLDPRPGQRFNRSDARLIEPDVAFVKRGDEYVVVMNEEDLPNLRLNQGYRRMLTQDGAEKEVKDYVKERYRSALQLMRNIEQRKNTILRTCEAIVRRQQDFLEKGVEALRPMMIKEVAEEIGVHPSTVSRAVSNKYVHTSQGVYELRFFFSEGVNGPEGGGTPLMLLKRKVKKLIEDEDPRKPLTDDQIAAMLQGQGIDVTRRTVAKYREDLRIPSTHQRRVRG
jgi:DNA-directed RNA polymerase specialized sigma54-like protein